MYRQARGPRQHRVSRDNSALETLGSVVDTGSLAVLRSLVEEALQRIPDRDDLDQEIKLSPKG